MEKQKVLLYGCGEIYAKNKYWISMIYDVVGVVDRKWEVSDAENGFYTVKKGLMRNFDKILVTTVHFEEIKKSLIDNYNISCETIIYFLDEFAKERRVSFGARNPDKCFYILRAHWQESSNGFYNFFNRAVRAYHYARKKGYELLIDMKNYYTEYAGVDNYGKYNVWEQYYAQPSQYSLEEAYCSKNVILSKFGTDWESERIGDIFEENLKIHEPFSKLGELYEDSFMVTPILEKEILREKARLNWEGRKILGVLMRGTDFKRCPKGHPIPHNMDHVINDVLKRVKEEKYDFVYLATEDSEILKVFEQKIGEQLLYTNQQRTDSCDMPLMKVKFARDNDGYLRGLEYCTVIEMLSTCDGIIANYMCGGTMAALTRNGGKYKEILVYDDGFYE